MSLIFAVFLGLVQGVTEFLPVSSSGHLAIFQNLFNMEDIEQSHLFFDVLLHFGTLISVVVVYRHELLGIIRAIFVPSVRNKGAKSGDDTGSLRLFLMLIIATLPLGLVVFLKDYIEELYLNTKFIGFALIVTGGLLLISDKMIKGTKKEQDTKPRDALIIGIMQTIAILPGLSRSGSTISAGLFRGFDREYAVRFSFLLSIPAIIGANILSLVDALKSGVDMSLMPVYLAGVVTAAVAGFFSIKLVKLLSQKGKFGNFAYYCWAVGLIAIVLT